MGISRLNPKHSTLHTQCQKRFCCREHFSCRECFSTLDSDTLSHRDPAEKIQWMEEFMCVFVFVCVSVCVSLLGDGGGGARGWGCVCSCVTEQSSRTAEPQQRRSWMYVKNVVVQHLLHPWGWGGVLLTAHRS